ncbi:rhomboid family intramembrane serine protease [Candidatus Woesearchaeota archaeon]|nr:rhomboid family intramembrane serine protease [Candidatus Woesearchaeota archaeon]
MQYREKGFTLNLENILLIIVGINAVAYLLQWLIPGFTNMFLLDSSVVWNEPWRFLTSMFLHSMNDPFHIIFNMMWVFFMGSMLIARIGNRRFLAIYLISGILAGILYSFTGERALGASGAVMGIIGVCIILIPKQIIYINFLPVPLWLAGIAFVVIDTLGIFLPNNVANTAHLAGLAVGLIYGIYLRMQKKKATNKISIKHHIEAEDMEEYMRSGRI